MSFCTQNRMEREKIEQFLLYCSEIDFGMITLLDGEKKFCNELNQEVISLVKSFPVSTQADALFLLMKCFKIPIGRELSFFMNYYAPAWSILYWLIQRTPKRKELQQEDIRSAKTAHSMALLLHPIDDHLNDGELPATHLTLLIRSQLWMTMNKSINSLAESVDGGQGIVKGFINDYYSSITSSQEVLTFADYCDSFINQMATGFIVPLLLLNKIGADEQFSRAVQSAYASFGIAWRLLDDINDIEEDMKKGNKSAVYTCLSGDMKQHWGKDPENESYEIVQVILEFILENRIIEKIEKRMSDELKSAADSMDRYRMNDLAEEYRSLSKYCFRGQDQR